VTIISNTSPILNLAIINKLFILEKLYSKIFIPEAVFNEITQFYPDDPVSNQLKNADWIIKKNISNTLFKKSLLIEIDEGEAEAIILALDLKTDLLLMDEKAGRKIAGEYNLNVTGVLGILVEAKKNNLISDIKSVMDELITKAGFRIHKDLYNYILEFSKNF
jgi:predicted nucleic acid-binding protein